MSLQQAQLEGWCLRYPDNLGVHPSISYEMAVNMLLRAKALSHQVPYQWGYIDKPQEGQLFLLFLQPQTPFPNDGVRYLEQETRYPITFPNGREMEVCEIKFGFVPNSPEARAWRVRRRYRLLKGGHPHLVLVHYTRGPAMAVIPALLTQPVRSYPLRPLNEPAVFVMGEKQGQTVYQPGGSHPPIPQQVMSAGMNLSPQAMLAHQNASMEALERRNQRERMAERNMAVERPPPPRLEDDDSTDELEHISTRMLALTRYRRNHELMQAVFQKAAFPDSDVATPSPPYAIFDKTELDSKIAKLTLEIEELQAAANARKARAAAKALESERYEFGSVAPADGGGGMDFGTTSAATALV